MRLVPEYDLVGIAELHALAGIAPFAAKFEFGGEWHYAGKGVKLGDADKAIFWYRPEGSGTYRVIYGDLKAADVAPENLPK